MRWMANTEVLPVAPVVDTALGRAGRGAQGDNDGVCSLGMVKLLGGPSKAPPYLTYRKVLGKFPHRK